MTYIFHIFMERFIVYFIKSYSLKEIFPTINNMLGLISIYILMKILFGDYHELLNGRILLHYTHLSFLCCIRTLVYDTQIYKIGERYFSHGIVEISQLM